MLMLKPLFSTLFFLTVVAVAEPPADDPSADDASAPEAGEATPEAAALPQPLAEGSVDFSPLTADPGFETWFDGVIRVERGGEVLFSAARGADASGEALDQDSIFWLGSISKTICSAAVLHMVDEGLLGLDDPIGMHLPGWVPTDASVDGEVCTVARLLSHECGFPREPTTAEMLALQDPLRRDEHRAPYLEAARTLELEFTPGSESQYSNLGYQLAGLLVMSKGEGSYDEILQRRLFAPLGLRDTGTEPSRVQDFDARIAPMSLTVGSQSWSTTTWLGLPADAPSRRGAAGNAFSTATELTRFFRALASGQVLTPETFSEMTRSRDADPGYGLGIVLRDRDGSPEYWHNGALAPHGFNTHISTFPTWDTTVTVLVARDVMVTNATRVGQRLIDALMGKDYRTPFADEAMDWVMANLVGIIFLWIPAWMIVSLLLACGRRIRKPRLPWALGVVGSACAFILLRGVLGMHGDGIDQWVLPGVVGGAALTIVWVRLGRDTTQPLLGERDTLWRKFRVWGGLVCSVTIPPLIGLIVDPYLIHFCVMVAAAVWIATRQPRAAA